MQLRILTLNTWGTRGPFEARCEALRRYLPLLAPDLVCLQEAFEPAMADLIADGAALPHRVAERSAGLELLSRHPIRSHRILRSRVVSPHEINDRRFLLAALAVGPDQTLWIGCTHLAWKAEDEATRVAQVEEILQATAPLQEQPIVLAGDLNATPGSESIRRLRAAGWTDAFAVLHPDEPGYTWDNRNPFIQGHAVQFPNRRIDYVWLNPTAARRYRPERCDVVLNAPDPDGRYPSDHFGLLVELQPSPVGVRHPGQASRPG